MDDRKRRQTRHEGGRRAVCVRLSTEELLVLRSRADQLGVTVPKYLVDTGLAEQSFDHAVTDAALAAEIRMLSQELLPVRRDLYGVATNLNQLAKWANTEHMFPDMALALGDEIGQIIGRLTNLLDRAAGEATRIARQGDVE